MLILNPALETQNTTHRYTIFTKSAGIHDGGAENRPIRKIVPKGKKENAPIFQNSKKWNRKIVPKLKN